MTDGGKLNIIDALPFMLRHSKLFGQFFNNGRKLVQLSLCIR
jgi:hypothetical protein